VLLQFYGVTASGEYIEDEEAEATSNLLKYLAYEFWDDEPNELAFL